MKPKQPTPPKIDLNKFFMDIPGFPSRLEPEPPPPPPPQLKPTLPNAHNATLANDVDPIVLAVKTNFNLII
jgi:hypothetical protein